MVRQLFLLACVLGLGAEELSPGAHKRLTCETAPQLTWDVYIPKAYAERPQERFPALYISSAGGNPGFWGFESFAERQGVLIIGINDSKNGDWAPIHAAQEAVLASSKARLRIHRLLRFATGNSGGAYASAALAKKCGDEFGGILFQINSQRELAPLKHICCAYLAGEKDTVYSINSVRGDYESARSAGNPVRIITYPDKGHDGMPRDDQVAMLDWMLEYQRYGHPKMNAEEAKAAQAGLVERVIKITALESVADRAEQADALLQSPVVAKGKQGAELSRLWCVAAIALADAEADLVQRYRRLETVAGSDRLTALPTPERKPVIAKMADLRKDKTVKADIDSRNALAVAQAAETKAGRTKGKLQDVLTAYQAILKRWPDALAAKDAEAGLARVKALLQ
jgi:hypothetical protein